MRPKAAKGGKRRQRTRAVGEQLAGLGDDGAVGVADVDALQGRADYLKGRACHLQERACHLQGRTEYLQGRAVPHRDGVPDLDPHRTAGKESRHD